MKDTTAGWLALGEHLIDRLAERMNRTLESDGFWLALVFLIFLAAVVLVGVQIDMATS